MNAKSVAPDENEQTEPGIEAPAPIEEAPGPAEDAAATSGEDAARADADPLEPESRETADLAPVQTVYIMAPQPPRNKGNRGLGSLLAAFAAVAFALVYVGIAALLILIVRPDAATSALGEFLAGPLFFVPVVAFLVLMVLWALLANRASWWSWVVGSLVIGVATYFASIGVLLLIAGGFGLTGSGAAEKFAELARNPLLIAAALLAREVAVWFGAAIAVRGRRVRQRNYDAWVEFEREEAEKRAEFGGPTTL